MAARDFNTVKQNISPAQAVKQLKKGGLEVSEKEAEILLDFLYLIGKLTVNQYLKENSKDL